MVHFSDKTSLIEAYQKIGRPLNKDLLNDLKSADAELTSLGLSHEYIVMETKCRVCNHIRTVIVVVADNDLENLRCANCENMACQENEPNDWEL